MAMGVPQKRWMVFVKENVNLKWMRTRGTPMAVEHPSVFLLGKSWNILDHSIIWRGLGCWKLMI